MHSIHMVMMLPYTNSGFIDWYSIQTVKIAMLEIVVLVAIHIVNNPCFEHVLMI